MTTITNNPTIFFMQKTELLYFRETLNADQAKQHNLVTRVLNWVDFDNNILTQCLKLASHQVQVYSFH